MKSVTAALISPAPFASLAEECAGVADPDLLSDSKFSDEENEFAHHPLLRAFAFASLATPLNQETEITEACEIESDPESCVSLDAVTKARDVRKSRESRGKIPEHAVCSPQQNCALTKNTAEAQDAAMLREFTLQTRLESSTRIDEKVEKTVDGASTKTGTTENALPPTAPRAVVSREGVDEDSLKMWWKRVHTYPLLSSGQEIALAKRIAQGDEDAVSEMIECNLRLVASIARKCKKAAGPLSLADLVQEGSIGLIRAVYKFDAGKGYKFSTYASYWIRQSILRAIDEQSRAIRLPVYMLESSSRAERARVALTQELQRVPTDFEVARHLQVSTRKVQEIGERIPEPISLDSYVGEDEESTLSDFIEDMDAPSPVDCATRTALREELMRAFECLDKREVEVLSLRYGLGDDSHARTLDEVGALLNLTRERIRQIEKLALKRLKHSSALRETARDYSYASEECVF